MEQNFEASTLSHSTSRSTVFSNPSSSTSAMATDSARLMKSQVQETASISLQARTSPKTVSPAKNPTAETDQAFAPEKLQPKPDYPTVLKRKKSISEIVEESGTIEVAHPHHTASSLSHSPAQADSSNIENGSSAQVTKPDNNTSASSSLDKDQEPLWLRYSNQGGCPHTFMKEIWIFPPRMPYPEPCAICVPENQRELFREHMVQQRKKWMDKVKFAAKGGQYIRVQGEKFMVERRYQGCGRGWELSIVQILPENFVGKRELAC